MDLGEDPGAHAARAVQPGGDFCQVPVEHLVASAVGAVLMRLPAMAVGSAGW